MRYWAGVLLTLVVLPCAAQDYVRVKYFPTYPHPNQSDEQFEIEVTRRVPYMHTQKGGVDAYFESVRSTLEAAKAPGKWTPASMPLHTPLVRMDIAVGGKRYELEVPYSERGVDLSVSPGARDEHLRRVVDAILKLTMDRGRKVFVVAE